MEKLVILGGAKLCGEVEISGAKNSAVAILAAAIMVKGKCLIEKSNRIRAGSISTGDASICISERLEGL